MTDDLETRVREFLARQLSVAPPRLTAGTRLGHDLGCDGDDARQLLDRFATEFCVDRSGFAFDHHFGLEAAFNPLLYLYCRLWRPERVRFVPLTVGDLVEAVQAGALRNPVRAAV
jgi:hypothetical protein